MTRDEITAKILERIPADGSTIGNTKLQGLLRDAGLEVSEEDYYAARDALVTEGVLQTGRGRGGSVKRAQAAPGPEPVVEPKRDEKPVPARKRAKPAAKNGTKSNGGDLGFEATLWQAADKLRSNMDASEYKHVVLGLIFLKYISDTFETHRAKLLAGEGDYAGAEEVEDDGEAFEDKMARLTKELGGQFAESARLEEAIRKNLEGLGYGL